MLWDSRKLLSPRSPQERKGRIIEVIQYSCRYACENEGYIPSFSNEMLNRGGDFNHFIPIGVLYLIYSNEHTTPPREAVASVRIVRSDSRFGFPPLAA